MVEFIYAIIEEEIRVNVKYVYLVNTSGFKKVTKTSSENMRTPLPLYPGYDSRLLSSFYPGAPVLSSFHERTGWEKYQPQTYTLYANYRSRPKQSRGTVGAIDDVHMVSAYHVVVSGTWEDADLPNSPCEVRDYKCVNRPLYSSLDNVVAQYLRFNPVIKGNSNCFILDRDIGITDVPPVHDKRCLIFDEKGYSFHQCKVYGVVSAIDQEYVYVAPLVDEMPQVPVFFTGSTSGTQILYPVKGDTTYGLVYELPGTKLIAEVKHGWVYKGKARPGDSGAPVFTIT